MTTETIIPVRPGAAAEQAVCGGSNIKAPMRLDFMRALRETDSACRKEIIILRGSGCPQPMCFEEESKAGDAMNCIGLVAEPSEKLTALLRAGAVRARVTALPWRRYSGMKRTRVPEIWLAFTFSALSTPLPLETQV